MKPGIVIGNSVEIQHAVETSTLAYKNKFSDEIFAIKGNGYRLFRHPVLLTELFSHLRAL
jgi:hypothetical protein